MKTRYTLALLLSCICAAAHPMGNFSVSHYAGFTVGPRGVELEYVLDLAEIPTFELLRDWKVQASGPKSDLERKAKEQAAVWLGNLEFTDGTASLKPVLERVIVAVADGAGNLPIMRITTHARIAGAGGMLRYEDRNYPDRAGWKEVVILTSDGVVLNKASQGDHDISNALTAYPADPTLAPPQDLRAEINWTAPAPIPTFAPVPTVVTKTVPPPVVTPQKPVIAAIPQPHTAPAAVSPALATKQSAPGGSVVRGDSLSLFLRQREFTPWMILVALVTAFVLGAAHALTPGHGKTIVAAYLVGSRGTLKHAAFLGAMVTFTHTIVVFALGLATLLLFQFIVPEKVIQALSVISGLSIVAMGAWVLRKRLKSRQRAAHHHHHHDHEHHTHTHDHAHPHTHAHDHSHAHDHHHEHAHDHGHHHGPGGHTHMPDEISWGGLAALGASGGLVPCESAVVLLLGAIALGRVGLGLLLLIAFSLGLALVLMSIGVLVVCGKSLLPKFGRPLPARFVSAMPIASAAFVTLLGVIMTGVSLGLIHPRWMLG